MKRILLLGGSGFIGRNIQDFFEKKDEYVVEAPPSGRLDLINEKSVDDYFHVRYFDVVLFFADYGTRIDKNKKDDKILEFNLRMFLNVEKNKEHYGVMFYSGTGAEYDKRYDIVEAKEEDEGKRIPGDDYGLMRYIIDRIIRQSDKIYDLKIFGLYGKYEPWQFRFISNCCCKALKGLPISIRQNLYFDYLYINDFLDILKMLLDSPPSAHALNITSGRKIDLETLAKIVVEVSGKDIPIIICKEGIGKEYTSNNDLLLKEIGNYEFTSYKDSIIELYQWYCENERIIDLEKLLY